MSSDTADAAARLKGITFRAWREKHYVTLAELLVRLGSFGLDLTWRVEFDEIVDPRCVELEKLSSGAGMDTLTLLSLTTPFLQLIDAEARGFAEDRLMVVLEEVDSSLWDVRAADVRVLDELRRYFPDAADLHPGYLLSIELKPGGIKIVNDPLDFDAATIYHHLATPL